MHYCCTRKVWCHSDFLVEESLYLLVCEHTRQVHWGSGALQVIRKFRQCSA